MEENKLNEENIIKFSKSLNEPRWILNYRLKSFLEFKNKHHPKFGPDLKIDFNSYDYFINKEKNKCKLKKNVICCSINESFTKYPKLTRKYFNKLITGDTKYSSLNGACFNEGLFIYVPPHVKLKEPIVNILSDNVFERNLIIIDHDSEITYNDIKTEVSSINLGTTEIFVLENSVLNYNTSKDLNDEVYSLETKKIKISKNALLKQVNIIKGSKVSMEYPLVLLKGVNAKVDNTLISITKGDQIHDVGFKTYHLTPETISSNKSYLIASGNSESNYRGSLKMTKRKCDANVEIISEIKKDAKSDIVSKNEVDDLINLNYTASKNKSKIDITTLLGIYDII
jgi:Fe-S cluster assembly protein SufB